MTISSSQKDYKNTVFLPKTSFPMKAGLSDKEPILLERWKRLNLYQSIRDNSKGREKFILHFGPPYANGHIHMGHALSEVLKDILNKVKQMQGFDAPMVPGWDCHGLPIEWQIEKDYQKKGKQKDDVDPLEFRAECREFAGKWMGIQNEELQRLGIVADWENPYSTMDFASEGAIVEEIGKLLQKGLIVRGLRPVMWSVIEKTALAEAEVEYKDHVSDAIFVAFPIVSSPLRSLENVKAVIWTTTPWSLPGNRAIAFGHFDYVVVDVDNHDNPALHQQKFLLAKDLHENVLSAWNVENYHILCELSGDQLKGTIAHHPLRDVGYVFDVPFLYGDHVTTDAGTGLVHTAPSHGMEDYILGRAHNLPVPNTLRDDGVYTHEAPHFEGVHVFKVNPIIMESLQDRHTLIHHSKLTHSYPHSWRSKAPIIYRATPQWFVDVASMRDQAMDAIANTRFVPAQGRHRIGAMVSGRPDWCISRQRAWGTPLTLFVKKDTKEILIDAAVHARIVEKITQQGADAWFTTPSSEFLGESYNADLYEKVTDVIDVWLDSGCTHAFVLEQRPELSWPADVYFEGSDQHRGWFQSSLLHSIGTRGKAPYKDVVTHGFILDEKGYKMSKSTGNGIEPETIIKQYGADILRLWVASVDYSEDVRIGKDILKQLEDLYRRFRNTLRYLLGALDGFDESERVEYENMPELERYILSRLAQLQKRMDETATSYDFGAFYSELHTFCAVDLSAFYFDIRKDSLYCDAANSIKRRATRTVMDILFNCLTRWLAPVLSFTAEEAYLSRYPNAADSIHNQTFYDLPHGYENAQLVEKWNKLRHYRRVMNSALEKERASKVIGSSLQGEITIYTTDEVIQLFDGIDVAEFSITSCACFTSKTAPSHAFKMDDINDMAVLVTKAEGGKCERCWRILPEVTEKNVLCQRCEDAV